jgi:uncharacterized RDD family membrane protein YckC
VDRSAVYLITFVTASAGDALLRGSTPTLGKIVIGVGLVSALFYAYARDAWGGRGLGKRLFGLRVVDEKTRTPIGFVAALKRDFILHVFPLPIAEIVFLCLRDGRRMGDTWARSVVVDDFAPPAEARP